jgi:voltage-gated potassium channel
VIPTPESAEQSTSGGTQPAAGPLRSRLWRIIFLSDTPAGKAFDLILLVIIALSVAVVMLESVASMHRQYGTTLRTLEWAFTILFTLEYLVRLWVVKRPVAYARSFFGIVDLLSFAPTYLEFLAEGSHYLMVLRVLRLLRIFRVLKMAQHVGEAGVLLNALKASRAKIFVFFFSVMTLVLIEGTIMYLIEGEINPGFRNIPQSIYWAIVTLTTVGYGDVAPVSVLGKMMASVIMLTGFAIIAVPTGVVTVEIGREMSARSASGRRCRSCGNAGHSADARFCHQCGSALS